MGVVLARTDGERRRCVVEKRVHRLSDRQIRDANAFLADLSVRGVYRVEPGVEATTFFFEDRQTAMLLRV